MIFGCIAAGIHGLPGWTALAVCAGLLIALCFRFKARYPAQNFHQDKIKSNSSVTSKPVINESIAEQPGVLYSPGFLRDLFVNTFPADTAMPYGPKFNAPSEPHLFASRGAGGVRD